MSFIQTGFLLACAAIAIPVIVHLLNRWQVRQIELGTMRFLQEIVRDGARRRTIRRWFLLLTRMALVMLLALLFARPFVAETVRRDGDRVRVILVDRSASMAMPGKSGRLVDDAVAAATRFSEELGEDAKVLWAWFDREVEPVPQSSARPSAPRGLVGDTNYMAALGWARDRIDAHPDSLADVVLVTDLQQSGLTSAELVGEELTFPSDVPVRLVDVGRPAANNLAITDVAAPATRLGVGSKVPLSVTLFNFGAAPFEEASLAVTAFDGTRSMRWKKSVDVPEGQAGDVDFDLGELDAGTWQITVAVDVDDDLAADNRRWTALDVADPIEVLVLDEESASDKRRYLVAALEQDNRERHETDQGVQAQGRFSTEVIGLAEEPFPALDPQSHRLVVIVDAGALSASAIPPLETYVRGGGSLLVFAGDSEQSRRSSANQWQQSALAPGELGRPQRSGAMPFRIVSVNRGGSMLSPFEDPQHGDLGRMAFLTVQPVSVHASTEVLASFDQQHAAITQHQLDRGRVVWFLSSADASWGNWTTSPLYLPLVQQMAGELLNLNGEGPIRFRQVGDPSQSGERSFSQPGIQKHPDAMYVVNGSAKESDPTRIDEETFAKHFGLSLVDATVSETPISVDFEKRHELWPWLAAAVFVLLISEFALANRTTA